MKARYEAQQTGKGATVLCNFCKQRFWRRLRSTLQATIILISVIIYQGYGAPNPARAETLIEAVGAIGMTVSDMERSIEFYQKVLSFKKVSDAEVHGTAYEHLQGIFGLRMRIVRMQLAEEFIELTEYLTPQGRPIPIDSCSNDHWFQHIAIIVSDMDKAYQWLRQHKVKHASTGPQRIPDWNKVAAGIELLEYMAPRDGRPYPADSKANDIWHWQIHAITPNPDDAFNVLRPGKTTFVSSGPVALPNKSLGFNKGLLIRDPDGHAILLRP
jgi:catechol 2,3-dioxygenase-like lactoylglutathione lyase family enzyme